MERRRKPVPTERGEQRRQAQREHNELRDLVAAIRRRIARAIEWFEHYTKQPKKTKKPDQSELSELVELATVESVVEVFKPDPVQKAQKSPMPVVETSAPAQAAPAAPLTVAADRADPVEQETAQADAAKEDQLQAAIVWLREHHCEAVLQYPPNGAHHYFTESIEMSRSDAEKAGWERTRDVIVPHLQAKQAVRKAALDKDRELHPEKLTQRGRDSGMER